MTSVLPSPLMSCVTKPLINTPLSGPVKSEFFYKKYLKVA